jgi:hypothetical protein
MVHRRDEIALMAFDNIVDAKRVLSVLGKRLARYGPTVHDPAPGIRYSRSEHILPGD